MKQNFCVFSLLLALFLIFSCANPETEKVEPIDTAFITLSINDDLSFRTVLPQKGECTDYSYKLYGSVGSAQKRLLKTWNTYDSMISTKVDVQTGEWIFELHALKNSQTVLTGISTSIVKIGENKIESTLWNILRDTQDMGRDNLQIPILI